MKKTQFQLICLFILFFQLCTSQLLKAQTNAFPDDSLTLVKFQKELIKKGWPPLWDTTKRVQNWYGIQLENQKGRVVQVNIWGDDLVPKYKTDSLPSCVKILQSLDSLNDLTFADLDIKYISDELWNFENLTSLGIHYNKLSYIPKGINKLVNLKTLYLLYNELTDLPKLDRLLKLEELRLTFNTTLTRFPASIFSLTNLQILEIDYSSIETIPDLFDKLPNLKQLDLQKNKIEILPPSIGSAKSLTNLNLNYNHLKELPESIGKLSYLKELKVENNQLKKLPKTMTGLTNLEVIDFHENQLESFPASIAALPKLYFINGSKNNMKGPVPPELFDRNKLFAYLENNELSGKLEFKSGKIPDKLFISNNCFTFKSIIDDFNKFDGNKHKIRFQPQKKLGTPRSFTPGENTPFTLNIDNYTPAEGCEFQWYKKENNYAEFSTFSNDEQLKWKNFNPKTDGGFYYCKITHPKLNGLSLESHQIRVIGEDRPPKATLSSIKFRQGNKGAISVTVKDDFSGGNQLKIEWPDETPNLKLTPLSESQSKVEAKDINWTGTDTIIVVVTDESGNKTTTKGTVTIIPAKNSPPEINFPDIYMNLAQEPSCKPGTPGCNELYVYESTTFLKYFITDDLTSFKDLKFKILEADASGYINNNYYVQINLVKTAEGIKADAVALAYNDTTIKVTLRVTDKEGADTTATLTFMGKGVTPNKHPEISASIPGKSVILKGTKAFAPLDLNKYVSDDYVEKKHLIWEPAPANSLKLDFKNSVAMVSPTYPDSCYEAKIKYTVYESTNYNRYKQVEITYSITNGILISGEIRDSIDSSPIQNVLLKGFPFEVKTNTNGIYEGHVLPGWKGTITPGHKYYKFTPPSISFNSLIKDSTGNNFKAGTQVRFFKISGYIMKAGGTTPLENVYLKGFPLDSVKTNDQGYYQTKVPEGWKGTIIPILTNYRFIPKQIDYDGVISDTVNQSIYGFEWPATFGISGYIYDNKNAPMKNVVLKGLRSFVTTDKNGYYTDSVPRGWKGTVTPVYPHYEFSPKQIIYNSVIENYTNNNYIGEAQMFEISGKIYIPDSNNKPLEGVYLMGLPGSIQTDEYGKYKVTVPEGWNGTVTPFHYRYTFSPENISYDSVIKDLPDNDFQAKPRSGLIICGKITANKRSFPLEKVRLQGFPSDNIYTDSEGKYEVIVDFSWSGTITPKLEGYTFFPGYKDYVNVDSNLNEENYKAEKKSTPIKEYGEPTMQFYAVFNQTNRKVDIYINEYSNISEEIRIYDLTGQELYRTQTVPEQKKYSWSPDKTATGIYCVSLFLENKDIKTKKLIIRNSGNF